MAEIVRPNAVRWLGYAVGAGLPARHRGWVLHDVTAPTWVLRHVARALLQIVPVAAVLYLVIPGPPGIRLAAIVMGALMGLAYSTAFVWSATEHRAMKAGYPEGTAEAVREERRRQRTVRHGGAR